MRPRHAVAAAGVAAALIAGSGAVELAPAYLSQAAAAPVAAARTGLVDAPLATATAATVAAPTSRPQLYRETVRYGARDTSPYQISHVYEVQIRLARTGIYKGPVTGYFGTATLAAVKAFQRSQRLSQTGVVNQATWTRLITVSRQRSPGWYQVPAACKAAGWHTCYSRSTYEVFTFYSGTLWNTWLVRGGAAGLQTVLGTYRVYWQDIDHRSAMFDNAPMPYSQFFYGGEALHGSATMMDPRLGHSHGCVNMYIEDATELWRLTGGRAHVVTVYGAWR
ncbi:MAG TPA: L,D-transpeptidase family protein [Mycobacteriales bacterium]|nr:L,D-transpeptidase family protein [Mycobacteriales bacterium]